MSNTALKLAIARCNDNQSEFARRVGTYPQKVRYWLLTEQSLPAEYVLRAEAETGVSRFELRPDIYPREDAAA